MAEKTLKRQYNNEYPSVTTILGVLRKIGLEFWFKYHTADYCDKASEKGKLIGTQIHEAIENYIAKNKVEVSTEHVEEVTNALKSFMLFRKEHPEFLLEWSEEMLTSLVHGFNGTMDCKATKDGRTICFDWKTGEAKKKDAPAIYDEYKAQVSAYVKAYNEVHNEKCDLAMIVSFAKDKVAYTMYTMEGEEIDGWFSKVFLPCLSIYNYQKQQKEAANV